LILLNNLSEYRQKYRQKYLLEKMWISVTAAILVRVTASNNDAYYTISIPL
jgi:hypothetical protein